MSNPKKYYWLKLKEDFFEETYMKALRRLPEGDKLVIIYLKLQLKNLRNEGILKYKHIMPNHLEEIALDLDEDKNIVSLAINALINLKAIELWNNDTLYLSALQSNIGKECDSAERVRRHREQKALLCNGGVTDMKQLVTNCNTEIREKREEKRENIYIDQTLQCNTNGTSQGQPKDGVSKEKKSKEKESKDIYFEAVKLTAEEYSKLVEKFGKRGADDRIENLSLYIQSKGDKYQSHYATILHWERKNPQPTKKGKYDDVVI